MSAERASDGRQTTVYVRRGALRRDNPPCYHTKRGCNCALFGVPLDDAVEAGCGPCGNCTDGGGGR